MACMRSRRGGIGIGACLCVLATVGAVRAGVIRHDTSDSLYLALAAEPRYASCGLVEWDSVLGSGSLVADDWVLTAAHVVDDASGVVTFSLGGSSYQAAEWFIHPDWNGDPADAGDLALIHLSAPVSGVTPAELYRDSGELEQMATIVGYGRTGNGLTGDIYPAGTKRAGNNLIGGFGSVMGYPDQVMLADLDIPDPDATGKAICLDLEYLAAPGDSGGGWFMDVAGQTYLVGVTSFATAPDGLLDFRYGDVMAATRVGQYLDWLDTYVLPPLIGDLNDDGFVGADDLDIVRAYWGQNVDVGDLLAGDPSGDGFVGADDLDIVRAHWGEGTAPGSVPEPSALVMCLGLGWGGIFLSIRRRKNA